MKMSSVYSDLKAVQLNEILREFDQPISGKVELIARPRLLEINSSGECVSQREDRTVASVAVASGVSSGSYGIAENESEEMSREMLVMRKEKELEREFEIVQREIELLRQMQQLNT